MTESTTQPSNNTTTPVIRQNAPTQQYQPNGTQQYRQNMPIKPVPDKEVQGSSLGGPQLNGPSLDRTTARPVRQATYQAVYRPDYRATYQPVVNRTTQDMPAFDYGGWQASNR